MKCEVINVGTELLLGQNINTNARDIGIILAEEGIDCFIQTTVGDNLNRLVSALRTASKRADAIVLTGGLGSTDDDLTRDAVAAFAGTALVQDDALRRAIAERIVDFEPEATEKTMRQALLPDGAVPIPPVKGTAAGFILTCDGVLIAATPGVPAEMRQMLESAIIPAMRDMAGEPAAFIISRRVKTYGLREIEVERRVQDIIDAQSNPTIAPLIGKGCVELRVSAKAPSRDKAEKLIDGTVTELEDRLGPHIFGYDNEDMEDVVGSMLDKRGLTVSLGESLTGGLIASRLIKRPGSSAYVLGGVVAYGNAAKRGLLSVAPHSILNHGAVSPQVAEEMALGARKAFAADIGLSTTGIAGPDGGTPDKPVGLVYVALSSADALLCEKTFFHGDRNEIRFKASQYALNMLRTHLNGFNEDDNRRA
jgi:nicotinamide-nucleotide amidase